MKLRQGCRLWWLLLPCLLIDRLSKVLALSFLAPAGRVRLLPGVISLAYVENRGMAFGMAQGKRFWLIGVTALVLAAMLIYLLTHPGESGLFRAGLWLVLGGGLGNLYDRIFYGFVVDMIRAEFIDFPVFNPADICVCLGAGLCILSVLIEEGKKRRG